MRRAPPSVVPFKRSRGVSAGHARASRRSARKLAGACLGVFFLTVGCGLAWPRLQERVVPTSWSPSEQVVRVIDGDTFDTLTGERVRILNIDTAEMPPRAKCAREAELALAAKARLVVLLGSGEVDLTRSGRDQDRYGRSLRLVRVDGADVGETLVTEGLAQRWQGRRADWC